MLTDHIGIAECGTEPGQSDPCLVLLGPRGQWTCPLAIGAPLRSLQDIQVVTMTTNDAEPQQLLALYWQSWQGGGVPWAAEGVQVWSATSARLLLSATTHGVESFTHIDDSEPSYECEFARRVLIDNVGAVVRRRTGASGCAVTRPNERLWNRRLPRRRIEVRWPRLPPAEGWLHWLDE